MKSSRADPKRPRIIRLWDLRASRGIVDHRDGADHLPPSDEAKLRARVHEPAGVVEDSTDGVVENSTDPVKDPPSRV